MCSFSILWYESRKTFIPSFEVDPKCFLNFGIKLSKVTWKSLSTSKAENLFSSSSIPILMIKDCFCVLYTYTTIFWNYSNNFLLKKLCNNLIPSWCGN